MPHTDGVSSLLTLPAYTTVTSQAFSTDGEYLATANDFGKIAIFKTVALIDSESKKSNVLVFQFDCGACLGHTKSCVNALKTLENYLIVALTQPVGTPFVLAFNWKDLIQQRAHIAWTIESTTGILPGEVNAMELDVKNEKLIIGGGLGNATEATADFAIRTIDLETRMMTTKPFMGHKGYVHAISHSNGLSASCSEDGTARTWDHRCPKPCAAILEPWKNDDLQRSKLGSWLGDISICGDWLVTGGGPRPALWHLKAKSPSVIPALPDSLCSSIYVTKIVQNQQIEDRVVLAGQISGGSLYQYGLDGSLKAEVKTSSSCLYTVETTFQDSFKMLSAGGSSTTIDLCTHNLSYSDKTINFPAL